LAPIFIALETRISEGKRRDMKKNKAPKITILMTNNFIILIHPFLITGAFREKLNEEKPNRISHIDVTDLNSLLKCKSRPGLYLI
jgi:hypothetical protein